MNQKRILISLAVLCSVGAGAAFATFPTRCIRLVLGEDNVSSVADPSPTADIVGQNDEYISNSTDGTWDFGAANLSTTGTITTTGAVTGDFGLLKLYTYSADPNAATASVTAAGVDTDDAIIATLNTDTGNDTYIQSAVPGSGSVVVYFNQDPAESVDVSVIAFED